MKYEKKSMRLEKKRMRLEKKRMREGNPCQNFGCDRQATTNQGFCLEHSD